MLKINNYLADRQTFEFVDIFKLVASLLVVCIHINPLTDFNSNLAVGLCEFVARIAVPFFFITSGFFCFRKIKDTFDIKVTNKYSARMFSLYLVWFAIYNVFALFSGKTEILPKIKAFFLGYSHLWYLTALAFAFCLLGILFYKKVNIKTILIISATLYVIGLFGETYYGLIFDESVSFYAFSSRNGLFFAPIYIVIGIMYAENMIKLKLKTSILATAVFALLWALEVIVCKYFDIARDFNMSLFMLPTAFFLFDVLLKVQFKKSVNTKLLRSLSTYIYLIHILMLTYGVPIVTKIIRFVIGDDFKFNSLGEYLITVLLSIVVSLILIKLQQVKGFRWLKILA